MVRWSEYLTCWFRVVDIVKKPLLTFTVDTEAQIVVRTAQESVAPTTKVQATV